MQKKKKKARRASYFPQSKFTLQSRDTAVGVSTCRLCKIDRCGDLVQDAVMASGFCNTCSQLLKEFADHLRSAWRELEIKLKEAFREIGRCNCFRISSERRTAFDLPSLRLNCGRKIAAMRIFLWKSQWKNKNRGSVLFGKLKSIKVNVQTATSLNFHTACAITLQSCTQVYMINSINLFPPSQTTKLNFSARKVCKH